MIDDLTDRFREKVSGITPLNKRALAKEIGVSYDRMNKWLGTINIKDVADREAVENWINGISKNNSKNTPEVFISHSSKDDYTKEYIDLLKKQIEKDKTELDKVNERLGNLEASLNVLLKSQKVLYSNLLGFQEEILNHLPTTERARRAALLSAHIRTNNHLEKAEKEGIPFGENK